MIKNGTESSIGKDLALRLRRALASGSDELYQTVQDPSADVLRNLLKNPALREEHLLALLKRRDLPEDLPKAIFTSGRFELSHRLQLALVKNPCTPTQLTLSLLPHLRLFELVDLLYLPGATPDQKLASEREITRRLPTVPLGNLLTLARRASPTVLAEMLKMGRPDILEACLPNPRLKEVAILQFLSGGAASAETISMIARHPRWKTRPRLQIAILKHPRTPSVWYTLWLPRFKTQQLNELKQSRRLSSANRKLVEEEIRKRQGLR